MPYGTLDLDYDQHYTSSSLVLPNSYYDPREGEKLYTRYLDELELADTLGYDGVCVNEHHQTAYGLMPSPGIIAGAFMERLQAERVRQAGRRIRPRADHEN